jgi:hypothetical protein
VCNYPLRGRLNPGRGGDKDGTWSSNSWVAHGAATTIDETSAASNGMELSDAEIDLILDALDYYERIERLAGGRFWEWPTRQVFLA